MGADLDKAIDRGLRARAGDVGALVALVAQADTGLKDAGPSADFAQILTADGRVFDASTGLGRRPLLTPAEVRSTRGPVFVRRHGARMLATPVHAQDRRLVIVVGAPLAGRDRALADLRRLLLIGGPVALLLASLAGYGLASAALRPVESMRRRAASISTTRLHQRLPLSPGRDELRRLGQTLNSMLDRLHAGLARERAFTADASHELRTPLTLLRTELELIARDRPTGAQLDGAVAAAVDEADRMTQLIDDLLVLARADSDERAFRRRASRSPRSCAPSRLAPTARSRLRLLTDSSCTPTAPAWSRRFATCSTTPSAMAPGPSR